MIKLIKKYFPFLNGSAIDGGIEGLVPAPPKGPQDYWLHTSGWKALPAGSGTGTVGTVTIPTYVAATSSSAGVDGIVKAATFAQANNYYAGDGTWKTLPSQVTYSAFGPATATSAGTAGLVPAPTAADFAKVLSGGGWIAVPAPVTYGAYSSTVDGLVPKFNAVADVGKVLGISGWVTPVTYSKFASKADGLVPGFQPADVGKMLTTDGWTALPGVYNQNQNGLVPKYDAVLDVGKVLGVNGWVALPGQINYEIFSALSNGLVPAPTSADTGKVLGTTGWVNVSSGGASYGNFGLGTAGLVPGYGASDGGKVLGVGGWVNLPSQTTYGVFSNAADGLVPKFSAQVDNGKILSTSGWIAQPTQVTYGQFSNAAAGLVPKFDAIADANKVLGVNGWSTLPQGVTYGVFSTSADGLVPRPTKVGVVLTDGGWTDMPQGSVYSVFSTGNAGLVPAPVIADNGKVLSTGGWIVLPTAAVPAVYQGATTSAIGVAGLVPAATSADLGKWLGADGKWSAPSFTVAFETYSAAKAYGASVPVIGADGEIYISNSAIIAGAAFAAGTAGATWKQLLSMQSKLTGIDVATSAPVTASDTVVTSIGKLQAQLTNLPSLGITWKETQRFEGSATSFGMSIKNASEDVTVLVNAPAGVFNFDIGTQSVVLITAANTANYTLNFRWSSTKTLESVLAVGKSATVTLMVTQGATAYIPATIQIDSVTLMPKWISGAAPSTNNANSIETYSFTIIRDTVTSFKIIASTAYAK